MKKINMILMSFIIVISVMCEKQPLVEDEKVNNIPVQLTVDSEGDVGLSNSITVNGYNVYISYYDVSNKDLKVAVSADRGTSWPQNRIKTIDSAGDVGDFNSIAVYGNNVYVSYLDKTNYNLMFAMSSDRGSSWPAVNLEVVDSNTGGGSFDFETAVTADSSNVYIAYHYFGLQDLKFARSDDGGAAWSWIITVDDTNFVGRYSSIAVDGTNTYISYYDITNGNLKFAKSVNEGTTWSAGLQQTIDSAGDVGKYTSIAVNGDNIYISYFDDTNGNLKFARSTDAGETWPLANIKTVDSSTGAGQYSSLAVSDATIYISYYENLNDDLKFARSDDGGTTWPAANIKTVDSTGNVGMSSSLAVNGSNVYISYYD
ncbi:MAG: exo-alpha-sialidase, partial [Spirochaetes bacterium]|nr:exo-alpha-sialidase [Spirochaetota bacterium]